MGPLAAIGIIKGKPFAPDARMKKIMTEALALANATSRSLLMHPRDPSWFYYPDSAWLNPLFISGYEFETPIPMIEGPVRGRAHSRGAKPFPPTGYRTLDARTAFFYGITGITPAMAMRLTGIGSQYLFASLDADKNYFDGSQDLQGDAAQGHSRGEILVVHGLRQPDALDARHAAALSARRQPELSVARRRAGRRWLHDGLLRPDAARGREARQLDSDHARQRLVHDPAPLQPARTVLHQEVAAERNRVGEVKVALVEDDGSLHGSLKSPACSCVSITLPVASQTRITNCRKSRSPISPPPPWAAMGRAMSIQFAPCSTAR